MVVLGDVVAVIPMAALVAVMIFVSAVTFDWRSVMPATVRRAPVGETLAMLATVAATVATGNLATGVGIGVLLSLLLRSRRGAGTPAVEGMS